MSLEREQKVLVYSKNPQFVLQPTQEILNFAQVNQGLDLTDTLFFVISMFKNPPLFILYMINTNSSNSFRSSMQLVARKQDNFFLKYAGVKAVLGENVLDF